MKGRAGTGVVALLGHAGSVRGAVGPRWRWLLLWQTGRRAGVLDVLLAGSEGSRGKAGGLGKCEAEPAVGGNSVGCIPAPVAMPLAGCTASTSEQIRAASLDGIAAKPRDN